MWIFNMKHEAMKLCTDQRRIRLPLLSFEVRKEKHQGLRETPGELDSETLVLIPLMQYVSHQYSLVACTTTVVKPSQLFKWILFINSMTTFFKLLFIFLSFGTRRRSLVRSVGAPGKYASAWCRSGRRNKSFPLNRDLEHRQHGRVREGWWFMNLENMQKRIMILCESL